MKKTDETRDGSQMKFDVREFSADPALARMVQERLSRAGPRKLQDIQRVLREARSLRRRLVKDAAGLYQTGRNRTP